MVLDTQRNNVAPLIDRFAKIFISISPNVLSWFSLVFAILAGLFFYYSTPDNYFLLIAVLFVFLNGFFDAIDGKVAKLTNKASKKGDFIDHAIDRYADTFILGGLALSIWCQLWIGLLAIIGMFLTSYMGTQAQAVGFKRNYSGLLGRADRLVLLMVFPTLQNIFTNYYTGILFGFTLIEWMLVYFAIIGNITAIQRFYTTIKHI